MNNLGSNIKRIRQERGFTRAELATRAGVAGGTIGYIEKGTVISPRYDTLRRIAVALAVPSVDTLVNGK